MIRHDIEMRRLAVELFERGMGSAFVSGRLGLPHDTVRQWLRTYRSVGAEVLLNMGKNHTSYSYETKVAAARAVVDEGACKQDAMARFGIASLSALENWCRKYRAGGADELRPKPKGRPKGSVSKPRAKTREEELEARVRYLEAENAYLKKLAALRAEKRLRAGRNLES